jgi:hypothetical protein
MLKRRDILRVTSVAFILGTAAIGAPVGAQGVGQADAPRLALKGYDPVAYFTERRPVQGNPKFEFTWDAVRYRFASDQHMSMFRSDPDRYAPQFAGMCTIGMSRGMKAEANPENWLISDGRLFVFVPSNGPARFQANPQDVVAAAERNWERLKDAPLGTKIPQ